MPVENTRIVVVGVPAAEKKFEVVEVTKKEAARLAALAATDLERVKRELDAMTRRVR